MMNGLDYSRALRKELLPTRRSLLTLFISLCTLAKAHLAMADASAMYDPICSAAYCKDLQLESVNSSREYDMKAAMLDHCLQLIKWPADDSSKKGQTLTIGLLGKTQFAAFDSLTDKRISGRKLVVKKLSQPAEAADCEAVFICASEKKKSAVILKQLAGSSVLTAGETARFAEEGGIINLLRDGKHIRLELNVAAAERSRFAIDPELIKWVPVTAGKH